ncbi:MAG: bifunctional diguanylate cyclase/phosphodiesterase [Gammaproteobacteria bacterium]|nr:MAG: bifunctional diguanylate cyclase/phosphodiesterase [Gammaproteobacteria bacterium]
MKLKNKSITFKYGMVIIIAEAIILAIFSLLSYYLITDGMESRLSQSAKVISSLINQNVLRLNLFNNPKQMKNLIGEELDSAFITNVSGDVIYSTRPEFIKKHYSQLSGVNPIWFSDTIITNRINTTIDGEDFLIFRSQLFAPGSNQKLTYGYAVIKLKASSLSVKKRTTATIFIIGSVLCVLLTSAVLLFVFRRGIVQRLNLLLAAFKEVEKGSLHVRVADDDNSDELGELQFQVNLMLVSLERRDSSLSDLQSYLSNIIDSMPSILIGVDSEGQVTQWNHEADNLTGIKSVNAIGHPFTQVFPRLAAESDNIKLAIKTRQQQISSQAYRDKNNKLKYECITIYPLTSNGIEGAVIRIDDITEQKQNEEKLRLSSLVFNDMHDGVIITDIHKIIVDVNPAFCEITGYSRDNVIGKSPTILSSGMQKNQFYNDMWGQIDRDRYWQGEVWNKKKNGDLYAEFLSISAITDENNDIINYAGIFTDITENKKHQEKLQFMAHYDVLTQLPNRALFADRFHKAIAHSDRVNMQLAVCFLDLDNFKPVNDTYGHETGDLLLIEVAERIKKSIREEDTISRQGGDEFTLLLNDIESFSQCERTLERIHKALSLPYFINGNTHNITASTGITLYPDDNGDIDTLLRHADQAMYKAKQLGRSCYQLFNTEQDLETAQKNHQLSELELALSNNELCLYYQPKVNMKTGKVFGVEALIRWIHPEKGLIPPLDFLPIIEGTELEIKVGGWVINQALQQLEDWNRQGIDLEVSVNISSQHLQSPAFFDQLNDALDKYSSINSQRLQLEILESSALGDIQAVSGIIKSCQNVLGVKVALDDFGTGYSSLTHMKNLSANTIKIDQTFVRDILDDPQDYNIIEGIIGLAHSFNREVIAEGVETEAHGIMLLIMGCDEAQGYGISRPIPAADIAGWLNNYTPNETWIAYAASNLTKQDEKITLLKLTLEKWFANITNILMTMQDSGLSDYVVRCHLAIWLNRFKQEKTFQKSWLDELKSSHDVMFSLAEQLVEKHQSGELHSVADKLKEFKLSYQNVDAILDARLHHKIAKKSFSSLISLVK